MWHALEIAQGKEFVSEMPEGLEAPITQGGTNVSGGQRQRLAIARALVKRPEIYVFDDSFSALDFTTDARCAPRSSNEIADATVIIVAQRVSTIMDADQHHRPGRRRGRRHRHARRAHGDLRDVPRDRLLAADRGGGRMSEDRPKQRPAPPAGRLAGRAAGFGPPGHMGWRRTGRQAAELQGLACKRLAGYLRPAGGRHRDRARAAAATSVAFSVIGPEDARQRDQPRVRGRRRQAAPARRDPRSRRSQGLRAAGQNRSSPTCSRAWTSPRARASTSTSAPAHARARGARLPAERAVRAGCSST